MEFFFFLRNGFVTFYYFECLEKGEIIFRVNFEFFWYYRWWNFEKALSLWYCVVVCYGTCFNYSSFFLSWMKANMAEFWKSKVWLVKMLWETKEFVVLLVIKSFFMFIDSFVWISACFSYIKFISILVADFVNTCVGQGICVFDVVFYYLFYCFCYAETLNSNLLLLFIM